MGRRGKRAIDLTNSRFGRLLVLARAENSSKHGDARWLCRCDCAVEKVVYATNLKSGDTASCGCFQLDQTRLRNTKHGQSGNQDRTEKASPEYVSWSAMRYRCLNPKSKDFKDYGGKGVKVCDRWLGKEGLQNFISDLGERPEGTTLGRKNDVGNYEPGNVSWMTRAEQVANWRPDRNLGGRKNKSVQQIAA